MTVKSTVIMYFMEETAIGNAASHLKERERRLFYYSAVNYTF